MDPFQRAEFLLKKGVVLKATQVDFVFLIPFPVALALSLMALLPSVSVGSSLIIQNSNPHPEVSPHSPRFLVTSQGPDSFSRQCRAPWQLWEILFGCQQEELEAA